MLFGCIFKRVYWYVMFCGVHGRADILEVDIAFLVAVFILVILSIVVAGKYTYCYELLTWF